MILPEFDNFELLQINKGHYFGEADLLRNREVRLYSMQAIEHCELYILNKRQFKLIFFQNFRELGEEILANALIRESRFKELEAEAKQMLEKKKGKKGRVKKFYVESFYKKNLVALKLGRALEGKSLQSQGIQGDSSPCEITNSTSNEAVQKTEEESVEELFISPENKKPKEKEKTKEEPENNEAKERPKSKLVEIVAKVQRLGKVAKKSMALREIVKNLVKNEMDDKEKEKSQRRALGGFGDFPEKKEKSGDMIQSLILNQISQMQADKEKSTWMSIEKRVSEMKGFIELLVSTFEEKARNRKEVSCQTDPVPELPNIFRENSGRSQEGPSSMEFLSPKSNQPKEERENSKINSRRNLGEEEYSKEKEEEYSKEKEGNSREKTKEVRKQREIRETLEKQKRKTKNARSKRKISLDAYPKAHKKKETRDSFPNNFLFSRLVPKQVEVSEDQSHKPFKFSDYFEKKDTEAKSIENQSIKGLGDQKEETIFSAEYNSQGNDPKNPKNLEFPLEKEKASNQEQKSPDKSLRNSSSSGFSPNEESPDDDASHF